MNPRFLKQIIIALIFLILLSGFAYAIYWLNLDSGACFDNVQNNNERGVDCGGDCQPCLQDIAEELVVRNKGFVAAPSGTWDFAAFIQNPNKEIDVVDFILEWQVFDFNGNLIRSIEKKSFIPSSQEKIFTLLNIELDRQPQRINLAFKNINWSKAKNIETMPNFLLTDINFKKGDSGQFSRSILKGNLINRSSFNFNNIDLSVVIFYRGEIVGINSSNLKTVLAGEERFFEMAWFGNDLPADPDKIEIAAYTNIFDRNNY